MISVMKKFSIALSALSTICALTPLAAFAAPVEKGLIGLNSVYGGYLQSHTDGELHASNPHRNEEETWVLVMVKPEQNLVALLNYRNGKFLRKTENGCVRADTTIIGMDDVWYMRNGNDSGIENGVRFAQAKDGTYLGTNKPGNDNSCGGEVSSTSSAEPPAGNSQWPGWWRMEAATEPPTQGNDFWNTIGGAAYGMANNMSAADVTAIIQALIAM